MSDGTSIEWTEATWNPITGCSVATPGCTNCYAMKLAGTRLQHHPSRAGLTRDTKAGPVWTGEVRFNEEWLTQPLKWKRPRMIFVCAHGDLFHESVPDEWIDRVFAVMALAPQHTFQVLTKRSDRMREYLRHHWGDAQSQSPIEEWEDCAYYRVLVAAQKIDRRRYQDSNIGDCNWWPLPNVWLGVSVEDQPRSERILDLDQTPAAVRWISAEPLIGPLQIDELDLAGIDWVVTGGESGPGARPMHPNWARSLRDQCAAAGVAFFFKQVGEWAWIDREQHHREYAAACNGERGWPGDRLIEADGTLLPGTSMDLGSRQHVRRVGKKAAGRLLDGVEHNAMPARAHA